MAKIRASSYAFAAGIFEGEGSFGFNGGSLRVQVGMTDEDVVRRFVAELGLGRVFGPYGPYKPYYERKPHWEARVQGPGPTMTALARMWSWLGERRRAQAAHAIATWRATKPRGFYHKGNAKP